MSFQLPALRLIFEVLDKTAAPMRGLQARLGMLSKQSRLALTGTGQTVQQMGQITLAATTGVTAAAEVQRGATMDALNDLESMGVKKLEHLRQTAVNFSDEWRGTTRDQFLIAAYDIKSGIESLSDDGVAATTTMAALTAKATKGMVMQLAGTFATGHGIYRKFFESDEQFAEQFGASIAAATKAFKTDGDKMSKAISGLGASASTLNVPLKEQIAILGMLQQTMEPGQSGTAYKAFIDSLGKVTEKTGQRFVDAAGNALPMTEILAKFRNALANAPDKAKAWVQITEAFGREEAVKVLQLLIERQDELGQKIEFVGEASKKGKQFIEEMARIRNKGEGSWMAKMAQAAGNLAETLGKALGPVMLPLMQKVHGITIRLRKWVEANPKLARTIIAVAGALGIAAVAVGGFTVAMAGLSMVAWTNPVTWIAAGITVAVLAIIAAGVLLYNYWDEITVWWDGIWKEWGGVITAAFPMIVIPIRMMGALKDWLVNNWDDIVPWFKNLWDGVVNAAIGPVKYIWQVIKWLMARIKQTIKDAISWLPDSAQDYIKGKLGIKVETSAPAAAAQAASAAGQAARASQVNQTAAAIQANQAARGEGKPQKSEVRFRMDFANAPKGATITKVDERGDADFNVDAGFAFAP